MRADPNDRKLDPDRDLLRRRHRDYRRVAGALRADPAALADVLRQIAKALDKPIEVIPARYSAVRADLAQLHQVPAGLTAKTLQNHKSNAKSALLWLEREKGIPKHGAPLTAGMGGAASQGQGRCCSLEAVVVDAVLLREQHPAGRGGRGRGRPLRELSVAVPGDRPTMPSGACWREPGTRMSGAIPGWPARRLMEPPVKAAVEVEWKEFPEDLRRDVDAISSRSDPDAAKPNRTTYPPPKGVHDQHPAGRAASCGPHGGEDRRADRAA